ncbi:hypothetical protein GXW82_25490 [Streptacidiphilus sp. 4-A2]|nr:hypothetical protein [Streptacidiphilus sp. 4-A2]
MNAAAAWEACFQPLLAALPAMGAKPGVWLPTAFAQVRLAGDLPEEFWVRAGFAADDPYGAGGRADVVVADSHGVVLAEFLGIALRAPAPGIVKLRAAGASCEPSPQPAISHGFRSRGCTSGRQHCGDPCRVPQAQTEPPPRGRMRRRMKSSGRSWPRPPTRSRRSRRSCWSRRSRRSRVFRPRPHARTMPRGRCWTVSPRRWACPSTVWTSIAPRVTTVWTRSWPSG